MPSSIYKYVIRFDISMYVVYFVHILYSQYEFADIKPGLLFSKNIFFDKQSEKISSWHPLHNYV